MGPGIYVLRNSFFQHALSSVSSHEMHDLTIQIEPIPVSATEVTKSVLWKIIRVSNEVFQLVNAAFPYGLLHTNGDRVKTGQGADIPSYNWTIENADGYYTFKQNNQFINAASETDVRFNGTQDSSAFWDLQYTKDAYVTIRNRKYGSYLQNDRYETITLAEQGIPRRFLWEATKIGDNFTLRNLQSVNKFLEIPWGTAPLVSAYDYPGEIDIQGQWRLVEVADGVVSITNQANNSTIQQNAVLEVQHNQGVNPVPETRSYKVNWYKHNPNDPPPHARWQLEKIAPVAGYALYSPPVFPPVSDSAAIVECYKPQDTKTVNNIMIGKIEHGRSGTSITPTELTNITIADSYRVDKVPNEAKHQDLEGRVRALDYETATTRTDDRQRQADIAALAGRMDSIQRLLRNDTANQVSLLRQETVKTLADLSKTMLDTVARDINRLITPLPTSLKKGIDDALQPLQTQLDAQSEDLKLALKRIAELEAKVNHPS